MSRARTIWRVGWRLGVCAVLLFWICHAIFTQEARTALELRGGAWSDLSRDAQWRAAWSQGPRELWQTLTLVRPAALAVSLVFMGLTLLFGVWRWRLVLAVQGLQLPFGRALEITLIAQFFNSFLLGSTGGDLIKAYYAARETHHKKTEAVVTVIADRLIGLFSMLLFAAVMVVPNLRLLLGHRELALLVGVLVCFLAGCGLLLALSFWGGVSRAWPQARSWLRQLPKGDALEQALEAGRGFGRERGFLPRVLGVSVLLNLACVLQLMSLAWGLGLAVPALVWFVVVPVVICISALPITPSGLGLRENLYVLALAGPGLQVPATQALSLSLLAYFGFLVWSLAGGVVYVCVRDRHRLAEVTRKDA